MSNDECWTPDEFFKKLPYQFTLDAAANAKNTKCKKFISKKQDALSSLKLWKTSGYVWLNPPFSPKAGGILNWIKMAHSSVSAGLNRGVFCLIICDVSTKSRQYAWEHATEIIDLSPRINFASPGKKGRKGGLQAYQLILFSHSKIRGISRWNWKDDSYLHRRFFNH